MGNRDTLTTLIVTASCGGTQGSLELRYLPCVPLYLLRSWWAVCFASGSRHMTQWDEYSGFFTSGNFHTLSWYVSAADPRGMQYIAICYLCSGAILIDRGVVQVKCR
jgi:hypothetical protein